MNAPISRLLTTGIYTIQEAAELVEASASEVRVWVEGRKEKQAPVIDNQVGRIGRTVAVSFTNLMELRFVATFANAGVRLNEIRAIISRVRDEINHPHPFATKTVFRTDGKKIVAEIARKNGVKVIFDLRSGNYEMPVVVLQSLKENVVWDPEGEALAWYPRPKIAPNVLINPKLSFGRPVLKDSKIPAETIAEAVRVEGSSKIVALLYDVPERQVREAVRFRQHLQQAA
jgi:uncharacterized protein (DUF433 family)